MTLIIFKQSDNHRIILNVLLSLYITLPLYIYSLFGVNKKYYKIIPIVVTIEAVIDNLLMFYNLYQFIYISRIVFYFILLIPLIINKKVKYEKDTFEHNIQKMSIKTAVIFITYMVLLIPLRIFLSEVPYLHSLFWAFFTLSYQIPGLLYSTNRLFQKTALFKNKELASLTKRENEVALAICEGYKYEEIAEKMFVSLSAVKKHSYNIYRKLGINNNRELIHIFMEKKYQY
jgi:DNA-binding CsgD family transcriptional regulator